MSVVINGIIRMLEREAEGLTNDLTRAYIPFDYRLSLDCAARRMYLDATIPLNHVPAVIGLLGLGARIYGDRIEVPVITAVSISQAQPRITITATGSMFTYQGFFGLSTIGDSHTCPVEMLVTSIEAHRTKIVDYFDDGAKCHEINTHHRAIINENVGSVGPAISQIHDLSQNVNHLRNRIALLTYSGDRISMQIVKICRYLNSWTHLSTLAVVNGPIDIVYGPMNADYTIHCNDSIHSVHTSPFEAAKTANKLYLDFEGEIDDTNAIRGSPLRSRLIDAPRKKLEPIWIDPFKF